MVSQTAADFVDALGAVVLKVLWAYGWIVIIAVVMTFFSPDPFNPFVRFFRAVTEPVFRLIRRTLPVVIGAVDLSPAVVLLVLYFLQVFLGRFLFHLADHLR